LFPTAILISAPGGGSFLMLNSRRGEVGIIYSVFRRA